MYHSHHNATDQVGRGLLGAFIVQPKDPAERYDRLYGATQDIVWISNDALGGFTINGRGFPATAPIVAKLGDTIVIRFMNEGSMMHPWHLHGMPMRVVARDGYPLGPSGVHVRHARASTRASAGTSSSTATSPARGRSTATSCPTPRATNGMFGMVTALVVEPKETALGTTPIGADLAAARPPVDPIRTAALAGGSSALICQIPIGG